VGRVEGGEGQEEAEVEERKGCEGEGARYRTVGKYLVHVIGIGTIESSYYTVYLFLIK
jgi:hypothetical protein